MTYPMQNLYLTEMEYEKDMERMKEMYPKEVHQLQEIVERRCDQMEYEGSRMYDENPDRYMLEREVDNLMAQHYGGRREDGWKQRFPVTDTFIIRNFHAVILSAI